MESLFIRPVLPGKISNDQVQKNISIVLREGELLKSSFNTLGKNPTYRTVGQFSFGEVFFLFGLKPSTLFRITQSSYAQDLPNLVVIHCNAMAIKTDNNPVIIEDKLFISHDYFVTWISSSDNEVFETEMLKLIMHKVEIKTTFSN